MNYSIEKISTLTGCDLLLASAFRKKQLLERKRRNLGESIDAFQKRIDRLDKELAEVRSVLTVYTTAYNALPEGKYKIDMNLGVKRLELCKARLEKTTRTCNVHALLLKQFLYNKLDAQVSAMDRYIDAVEGKRASLKQVLLHVTYKAPAPALRPAAVRSISRFEKKYSSILIESASRLMSSSVPKEVEPGILTDFMGRRQKPGSEFLGSRLLFKCNEYSRHELT